MLESEVATLGLNETNPVNRAKMALAAGDRNAALKYWRDATTRNVAFVKRYEESFDVALDLELFDEAEALIAERAKKAPGNQIYAEGQALVVERRGNLEEASRRWTAVRKRFPHSSAAYINGAACLRRLNRVDDAEQILKAAIDTFPRSASVRVEWVRCAQQRGDWETMLQRATDFYQTLDHVAAASVVADALAKVKRFDEAAAHLAKARARWPGVMNFPVAQAQLAYALDDKVEAAKLWGVVRTRFPLERQGYKGEITTLRELRQLADAEVVAADAADRFPDEVWAAIEYAKLAAAQHHWDDAVARWAIVREKWPQNPNGFLQGAAALARLGRSDEADTLRREAPKPPTKS